MQQNILTYICVLFFLSILILPSCKTSRKAASSKAAQNKVDVAFDADEGMDSSSEASSASTKMSTSSTTALRYPAQEYYGSKWNTEHVRINSDPKPVGTTTLSLVPVKNNDFVMPVCGKILSEFGPRGGRMHTGIDLKLEMDDPVYCAFDGMVRMAKNYGNYGKMVVIRHNNGLETLYSHLNSIAVKQNQRVKAGERIGGGGKTGNAQGEHLHFEIRFQGEPFNPRLVVDFEKCCLKSQVLVLNNNSYQLYYKNMQMAETKTTPKAKSEEKIKPALPADSTQVVATPIVPEHVVHIVEKGDTLYNISRRYGTTVDSLRQLNQMTESSILEIGQKIVVK